MGAAGGSAAVYQVALGLGLAPTVDTGARPDLAPLDPAHARSVVILGAGISALTAAYELSRKGYRVTVLEAGHRAGGRNLTLRHGDLIDEIGDPRRCEFDPDPELYFNAGPARIPGIHRALLGYCREFGVRLAPFVNENRQAWMQDDALFGGQRIRNHDYINDSRGFIAELAAKSIKAEDFGGHLTAADVDNVRAYLQVFGNLDEKYKYSGQSREGRLLRKFRIKGDERTPLDARALLASLPLRFTGVGFPEIEDQSAMMMEAVGGMDRIVDAFMQRVAPMVRLHSQVDSIRLEERGVRVVYSRDGKRSTVTADYCLNCIPTHLIAALDHNFPADYAAGMAAVDRGKLFKIGFQAKERFWERENIYGGISWTSQDITQIWYPSHGMLGQKAVILGAYTFRPEQGDTFAAMTHAQRLEVGIQQGEKLHPGYRGFVEHGVSIPWQNIKHLRGCAAGWKRVNAYAVLRPLAGAGRQPLPDGRPDQRRARLAGRCDPVGVLRDRRHRPARARAAGARHRLDSDAAPQETRNAQPHSRL